jgi:hypothetical protein
LDLRNHWRIAVDPIGVSARGLGYDPMNRIQAQNLTVTAVLEEAKRVMEFDGDGTTGFI